MASPFFFVSKKEKGAFRPCQDYRELNKATIKNAYPLPLVSDLIDKLKGAQYFTKLDLRNGYNNIRIKDRDQWKAAFKTNKGLFEPMVMFFGLSNSPATFQSFMDDIFADYIEEGWIVIYMDDILIFSSDLETHQKRTIKNVTHQNGPWEQFLDNKELMENGTHAVTFHILSHQRKGTTKYMIENFSVSLEALESWRHYLMGGKHPITILSDHKNLMFFKTAQKLNRRQARWSLFLSQFDLQLIHTPGTKMTQSDALSRRPDHIDNNENDNDNVVMLPDKFFLRAIDVKLREDLIENLKGETLYDDAMRTILKEGPSLIKSALEDWTIRDRLLFYKNRCYVPNQGNLRHKIVKTIHKAKGIGHPGQFNTLEQVSRDYWWLGMAKFVKMFVDGCAKCQESKSITHPNKPPLLPIEGEKDALPFSKITMDLITDLPESEGYDTILVVVDHSSTKGVIFSPCNKTIDAEQTATLLLNNVYKQFGLPNKIISDRDPRFAAKVFQELGKQLGVKHMMSTTFHPQTDRESPQ
uniref:Reverse transcriptase-rnase h-integrase n=1 Tax=Moniliophthora roreri TaxID=221103 RepID=A0A0W0EU59_MONRR